MSRTDDRDDLAPNKALGLDVEDHVVAGVDAIEPVDGVDHWHDVEVVETLGPAAGVRLASQCVVAPGTVGEIKAARRRVSNGVDRTAAGRWYVKGRDDGQHAKLVEADGVYLLAVYDERPDAELALLAVLVVPARLLDLRLNGRWSTVDRDEGTIANLPWTHLLDDRHLAGGAFA